MKLSVVLATYNEENNLSDCLKSVKDIADEIVVVDGESTDSTRDIAQKFGAKVYLTKNVSLFHINKQLAVDKAKGEWILQLDADEQVDTELKRSIKNILSQQPTPVPVATGQAANSQQPNGYYLKRKNYFLGHWLKKGGQYPDPVIRLVRRGHAHFPQKSVHEQIVVVGQVGTLEGHLLHYTAPTFIRYLRNSNRYTSLTAFELKNQYISLSLFNWVNYLCFKPLVTFLSLYIRHKGILDGFPGFVFALFSGLHWSIAFMKYWELVHVRQSKS